MYPVYVIYAYAVYAVYVVYIEYNGYAIILCMEFIIYVLCLIFMFCMVGRLYIIVMQYL